MVRLAKDGTFESLLQLAAGATLVVAWFGQAEIVADAHHNLNGLELGPAGELLFGQGLNNTSAVETPWGISLFQGAGVFRYRPRTGRLDAFFHSNAGLNVQGVTPGMVPGTTRKLPYWPMVAPDRWSTGIEIIGTTHLPDELQGRLVWGGFMSNNVQVHRIVEQAAAVACVVEPDLIRSSRREFRPVGVRVGGDGAIYVCDWYNPVIGHYQFSYSAIATPSAIATTAASGGCRRRGGRPPRGSQSTENPPPTCSRSCGHPSGSSAATLSSGSSTCPPTSPTRSSGSPHS